MGGDPWGGSEELWTRTSVLLAKQGMQVAASVRGWPQLDRRTIELSRAGVDLRPRPIKPSLLTLVRRYMTSEPVVVLDVRRSFGTISPSLVIISAGFVLPPIELVEMCAARKWPFATLTHANHDAWWPTDELAARWRQVLPLARRCFFVSEANRALAVRQLGYDIDNAEIVFNPIIVETRSPIPWPPETGKRELRMACVGMLLPNQKGQDLLLDVLADSPWKDRNWRLTLYGNGANRDLLARLIMRLGLEDRVFFGGHVTVEKIWEENHVLIMPSRFEGGPMTTIEAMWCGRPVIATAVGVNPKVINEGITGFLADAPSVGALRDALERMWTQRDKLKDIGTLAAASIREIAPSDPVRLFAERLRTLAAIESANQTMFRS